MYNNILLPTDLDKDHMNLAERAAEIAKRFNSNLYLLHVIELPTTLQVAQTLGFAEFDRPTKEDAQAVMKNLGEALNIPTKQQFVEIGSIKMEVLKKITALKIDLVILGSHVHNYLPSFLDNSALHLEQKLPCDVLILQSSI